MKNRIKKISRSFNLFYLSYGAKLLLKKHKPKIIGITGTAGKTTVTQMLGSVLMQKSAKPFVGNVGKTSGNRNNDLGLRFSILNKLEYKSFWEFLVNVPFVSLKQLFSSEYPNYLVLEYGTSAPGRIKNNVLFAPPHIAIVTNIGPGHLEKLKTENGVYKEKRALVQAVPVEGLVVLGLGHKFVNSLKDDSRAPVIEVDGRGFELAKEITRVVCEHLGLPKEVVEEGIATYEPQEGRLKEFNLSNITVIDDSFNANVLSMKYGLDIMNEKKTKKRKVAILGEMAQLGENSAKYHKEIGIYAKKSADLVIGVGKEAEHYNSDLWFATSALCSKNLSTFIQREDFVFIKGSNSSKMDVIVQTFKNDFTWNGEKAVLREQEIKIKNYR